MATVFTSPDELPGAIGSHLGHSEWLEIDQDRINLFADCLLYTSPSPRD